MASAGIRLRSGLLPVKASALRISVLAVWFASTTSLIILLSVAIISCNPAPLAKVRLTNLEKEASVSHYSPELSVIRFAVAPVFSRQTTQTVYKELLNYIGDAMGKRVELVQGKSYGEINNLVRSGDITVAIVCSGAFVAGEDDFGMEALVIPEVGGKTVYYSYLIVPKDSLAENLADLHGKTFAFTDPLSTSGRLVPLFELAQLGEKPETFFKRSIFTYSHQSSIKAVAGGLVNGAAVDSLVYDYLASQGAESVAKTKVIWLSPPLGMSPVAVHPALNDELKSKLRQVFLAMHQNERGRNVLADLLIDRFVLPKDGMYDSVRAMRRAVFSRGK